VNSCHVVRNKSRAFWLPAVRSDVKEKKKKGTCTHTEVRSGSDTASVCVTLEQWQWHDDQKGRIAVPGCTRGVPHSQGTGGRP